MKKSFWQLDYFISPFSNNRYLDCSFVSHKDEVFEISEARLGVPGNRGAKGAREHFQPSQSLEAGLED